MRLNFQYRFRDRWKIAWVLISLSQSIEEHCLSIDIAIVIDPKFLQYWYPDRVSDLTGPYLFLLDGWIGFKFKFRCASFPSVIDASTGSVCNRDQTNVAWVLTSRSHLLEYHQTQSVVKFRILKECKLIYIRCTCTSTTCSSIRSVWNSKSTPHLAWVLTDP